MVARCVVFTFQSRGFKSSHAFPVSPVNNSVAPWCRVGICGASGLFSWACWRSCRPQILLFCTAHAASVAVVQTCIRCVVMKQFPVGEFAQCLAKQQNRPCTSSSLLPTPSFCSQQRSSFGLYYIVSRNWIKICHVVEIGTFVQVKNERWEWPSRHCSLCVIRVTSTFPH